jgi:ribosomal protein S21
MWELEYDTNEEADEALKKYKDQHQKLAIVLQVSIEATKKRLEWEGKKIIGWA